MNTAVVEVDLGRGTHLIIIDVVEEEVRLLAMTDHDQEITTSMITSDAVAMTPTKNVTADVAAAAADVARNEDTRVDGIGTEVHHPPHHHSQLREEQGLSVTTSQILGSRPSPW